MFVAAPIRRGFQIIGVVSISKAQSSLFAFRDETVLWIRSVLLVAFAAMTVGAYLVVTLFSRPVRRLTAHVRRVARGERVPLPTGGSPEIATLGRAFEEMRDALENRKYVESYVQTLTHEMKSPVAAIRGAAELLREEVPAPQRERFLANIQAEAGRLENIIERLLALAAIESRKNLEAPSPLPVAAIVREVCANLEGSAQTRGVKLQVSEFDQLSVLGEAFLLEIALTNLLQNAIDFSPTGTSIHVELRRVSDWSRPVQITIEDEGTGIPDYALPRVFERFYSLQHPATGRKSSGLGLCFVRESVELHGGTVSIENRPDGRGVRATLRFPEAATSPQESKRRDSIAS
jgi:two-component system sensor histidine kinase CreC